MTHEREGFAPSPLDVLGEHTPQASTHVSKNTPTSYQHGALGDVPIGGPLQALRDAFPGTALPIVEDPTDGLPRPADNPVEDVAPFNHESQVCIEDDRQWVEVFVGEDEDLHMLPGAAPFEDMFDQSILVRQEPYTSKGAAKQRRVFPKSQVTYLFGVACVPDPDGSIDSDGDVVHYAVRPIRPACKHYNAQILAQSDIQGAIPLLRFCAYHRTVGGAQWSLFDQPVLACTARSPRDPESDARVARREERKMEEGRNRVYLPMFKLDEPMDWWGLAKQYSPRRITIPMGKGTLHLITPEFPQAFADGYPKAIVLPDKQWQPEDPHYVGRERPSDRQRWGAQGQGNAIMRLTLNDPTIELESQASLWPDIPDQVTGINLPRYANACAQMLREGHDIAVVGGDLMGIGAFFASCILFHLRLGMYRNGLDALDVIKPFLVDNPAEQEKAVPSFAHRTYLRIRLVATTPEEAAAEATPFTNMSSYVSASADGAALDPGSTKPSDPPDTHPNPKASE